ncbi:M24 family metallopeptidase [Bacillus salitolerans]|uniref:M24 family metallopeptidase n=1 Tax=Bacillus salitolerans TaxID=1437434 RepID=A0ABW4LXV4_9BACI
MNSSNSIITLEKLTQAEGLLKEHEIDTWLILSREGSDPSLPLVVGVRSVHLAAIFIRSNGEHIVLTSQSDRGSYESTKLFKQVITYEAGMEEAFLDVWTKLNCQRLALNISENDHMCDGLSQGLYEWLTDVLGDRLEEIEVSSEPVLSNIRSIKSKSEIECIQKAIDHTTDIFETVFSRIECGMTEIEIGELFVKEMKARGVTNGLGEPYDLPLVCTVRNGLAHRKPGPYKTEPGDIIIIDFSLKYEHYVSDIARTCYILKPGEDKAPDDIQHAFDTAIDAITKTIEAVAPGKKGYEIDAAGRKRIVEGGYPTIRHSVGHQIGRSTHNGGTTLGPRRTPVRPQVEGVLQAGEVYAIEPTVIQDNGLPCILVEENILVTEQGPVILSKRQTELVLIPSH